MHTSIVAAVKAAALSGSDHWPIYLIPALSAPHCLNEAPASLRDNMVMEYSTAAKCYEDRRFWQLRWRGE